MDRDTHDSPIADRPLILVRPPSPALADGEVTHIGRSPVDADLALRQWHDYVDAFRRHGWDVIELDPLDDHPDGVFVEDVVVVFGDLAVVTRPGAVSRRGEIDGLAERLGDLGYRVRSIEAPATLDGGDVMKIGRDAYVGLGGRTNAEGIDQLRGVLDTEGIRVHAVPTTKVLHLKSAVTALPDGTVVGYEPLVDDPTAFDPFLPVPEEPGAHVVDLGDGRLLLTARTPRTVELLARRGHECVVVDIGEFEKLEGCVTCLSVRLRTMPDVHLGSDPK